MLRKRKQQQKIDLICTTIDKQATMNLIEVLIYDPFIRLQMFFKLIFFYFILQPRSFSSFHSTDRQICNNTTNVQPLYTHIQTKHFNTLSWHTLVCQCNSLGFKLFSTCGITFYIFDHQQSSQVWQITTIYLFSCYQYMYSSRDLWQNYFSSLRANVEICGLMIGIICNT